MLTLHVHTVNLDFLDYLNQESTFNSEKDAFLFSNTEQASRVISRYFLYSIKEGHLNQLSEAKMLTDDDKDEILYYISNDKMKTIYHFIYQKLLIFLSDNSSFNFEGFLRFRLHKENEMIGKLLHIAYYDYMEFKDDPSNIHHLKRVLSEQPTIDEEVSLYVENDGSFTIKGKEHTYLEGETDEDTMLSHLILLAPLQVNVYETNALLSPTYSLLLSQVFEKKVVFHGFKNSASSHKKTEK